MNDSLSICPQCGSEKVLRSHRKGIKERLLKLLSPNLRFYRCHKCGARYMRESRRTGGRK